MLSRQKLKHVRHVQCFFYSVGEMLCVLSGSVYLCRIHAHWLRNRDQIGKWILPLYTLCAVFLCLSYPLRTIPSLTVSPLSAFEESNETLLIIISFHLAVEVNWCYFGFFLLFLLLTLLLLLLPLVLHWLLLLPLLLTTLYGWVFLLAFNHF